MYPDFLFIYYIFTCFYGFDKSQIYFLHPVHDRTFIYDYELKFNFSKPKIQRNEKYLNVNSCIAALKYNLMSYKL